MKRFIRNMLNASLIGAALLAAPVTAFYLVNAERVVAVDDAVVVTIIAASYGVAAGPVAYLAYRALKWVYSEDEVTPEPPRPRAMPTESRYKLAPRDVRAIRASDASVADLAVVYDVSENHITAIKQRKRWRSVR